MANYYTDHPEIEFHLNHPLMKRVVRILMTDIDLRIGIIGWHLSKIGRASCRERVSSPV